MSVKIMLMNGAVMGVAFIVGFVMVCATLYLGELLSEIVKRNIDRNKKR